MASPLKYRWIGVVLLNMLFSTTAFAAPPNIKDLTSAGIKTLQFDVEVVQENRTELKKIGGDFADAYRFHKLAFAYEQPGKLHYETTVMGAHIAYTINGDRKFSSVPSFHVHKIDNVGNSPGKKQTLLDSGLLPPEVLDDYNATFLRKEGANYVYELTAKQQGETAKDVVWIDPATKITVRRLHYSRDGKLDKSFVYGNPVQPRPKIFVPTRVEVYNNQNKLAAVSAYKNVKVNLPVDETLFNF